MDEGGRPRYTAEMAADTLTIARELKAAELPPAQAEAVAAAIGRSISEGSATKGDLLLFKQEVHGEFAQLRAEMKANMEQLRTEMKANMERLRTEMKANMEQLRTEMKANMERLRTEMERMRNQVLLGVFSSQVALAGVILAVLKL